MGYSSGVAHALHSFADRPDRAQEADRLQSSAWPEHMLHDAVANELFVRLFDPGLREYQQMLCDEADAIVGIAYAIPLAVEPGGELPDTGWDWALRRGVDDHRAGRTPTALCAISAAAVPGHQGKGIGAELVHGMRRLARRRGLQLVAPVRPNLKARYPLIPMDRYVRWEDGAGLPFDPWLRVHVRLGARITRVAPRSMTIAGSVSDWERWTGLAFPGSGSHVVPGALAPVEIDRERDVGTYVEPNVWVVHAPE